MRNPIHMLPLIMGAMLAAILPAHATDKAPACGQLTLFNEVQLQMTDEGLRPLIPVQIDGHDQLFVFDTGNALTAIAEQTAKALDIKTRDGGNYMLADVSGNLRARYAAVSRFAFGKRAHGSIYMPVWPDLQTGIAGSFGLDFMTHYDTDIDFGTGMLRMFDRDHCPGGVIYWQAPAVGEVPITIQNTHVTVPVEIDGHMVTAIIDTGAEYTVMTRQTAREIFGITTSSPDTQIDIELRHKDQAAKDKAILHIFNELAFGDIQVKGARVVITPDMMSTDNPFMSAYEIQTRQRMGYKMPDLIIGMNILRKLHVYMAFGENRLYVSPASTPGAAAQNPSNMPSSAGATP
ncbi:MAG TPA: retroviral-like aspartic protease family protein [Rhizomicrobium sp.]|jgi:predicted aspartyl protease